MSAVKKRKLDRVVVSPRKFPFQNVGNLNANLMQL